MITNIRVFCFVCGTEHENDSGGYNIASGNQWVSVLPCFVCGNDKLPLDEEESEDAVVENMKNIKNNQDKFLGSPQYSGEGAHKTW